MKLVTLRKRRDFILSNKHGQKAHNKNFILQEHRNPNISDKGLMFGFTATKRIGNAVKRNRAKRRMRALISGLLKEDKILFKELFSEETTLANSEDFKDKTIDELQKLLKIAVQNENYETAAKIRDEISNR